MGVLDCLATKKHAVVTAGSMSYGYDANGNLTSRNGATLSGASYDLPSTIHQTGGNSSLLCLLGGPRGNSHALSRGAPMRGHASERALLEGPTP